MRSFLLTLNLLAASLFVKAEQPATLPENPYAGIFEKAYEKYPVIPKGLLEAVAYTNTRFHHITHDQGAPESCMGLPQYYGVMGMVADGKNYFQNNLVYVSQLSGYSPDEIIASPEKNIMAYAAAYAQTYESTRNKLMRGPAIYDHGRVLRYLAEFPDDGANQYPAALHLYSVMRFLTDPACAAKYNFGVQDIDLERYFGAENLKVLGSSDVTLSSRGISDKAGNMFNSKYLSVVNSPDHVSVPYTPLPACNFSAGRNKKISEIIIHNVEGTYAGCISWMQNCAAGNSVHYIVRSSDGQVTQLVLESNTAIHAGDADAGSIGIQHEGYSNQGNWYSAEMLNASAALCADICASDYGISPLSAYYGQPDTPGSCTHIKGHQHLPGQTHADPGPNWDWNYFYKKLNPQPASEIFTAASGTIYDSGGGNGNYGARERAVWTISPDDGKPITLTFHDFHLKNGADNLYVYDGADVWSPLIGRYTGSFNPGTLSSDNASMTLEFRSDCNNSEAGWVASWGSKGLATENVPGVFVFPNPFTDQTLIQISGMASATTAIELTLLDIYGREILQLPFTGNQLLLDRKDLKSGIYFYRIENGTNMMSSGKLVAE